MNLDPLVVLDWLRWTVYMIYGAMLPVVFTLAWLELKHPTLYAKLPRWLH